MVRSLMLCLFGGPLSPADTAAVLTRLDGLTICSTVLGPSDELANSVDSLDGVMNRVSERAGQPSEASCEIQAA
jgi:hypothetical protein